MNYFRKFCLSFVDKSANISATKLKFKDLWGFLLLALTTITNLIGNIKELLVSTLGLYASIIPFLILIVAIIWSIHIIYSTITLNQSVIVTQEISLPKSAYSYPQILRIISKGTFLLLLILLPFSFLNALEEITPLPQTIYGRIIDVTNGGPVQDARVRILTKDNVDVTRGEWATDSKGFYIVKTSKTVQKNAQLLVIVPPCNKSIYLPLFSSFRLYFDSLGVNNYIYQHSINPDCK